MGLVNGGIMVMIGFIRVKENSVNGGKLNGENKSKRKKRLT